MHSTMYVVVKSEFLQREMEGGLSISAYYILKSFLFTFYKKKHVFFYLSSFSQYVINVSGKSATISLHLII